MELCAADGFSPIALLEASDPHTVRELVDAGLGVAVVPRGWAAGNAAPELAGAPAHGLQLLQPAAGTAPAGLLLAQRVVAALG
jgi:DNA-binding transcriptional LysR family regulator